MRPACLGIILLNLIVAATQYGEPKHQVILIGEKILFNDPWTANILWKTGAIAINAGYDVVPLSFTLEPATKTAGSSKSVFLGKQVPPHSSPQAALLKAQWRQTSSQEDSTEILFFSSIGPSPTTEPGKGQPEVRWLPLFPSDTDLALALNIPTHWFTATDLLIKVDLPSNAGGGTLEFDADGQVLETRSLKARSGKIDAPVTFSYRSPKAGPHTLRLRARAPDGALLDETGAVLSLRAKPDIVYVTMPGADPRLLNTLQDQGFNVRQRLITSLLSDRTNPLEKMKKGDLLILDAPSPGYLGLKITGQLEQALARQEISLLYLPYGGSEKTGLAAIENLLPVYQGSPPRSDREKTLALVTIVDTSFSMFFPQVKGGVRKIEMAKKALLNLSSAVRENDRLGIMGTDLRPYWITDLKVPRNPRGEAARIARMTAVGPGINFYSSLLAASEELDAVSADIRHILVLLDTADVDEYTVLGTGTVWNLLQTFHEKGITVSLVGFGGSEDEHVPALNQFAENSGGFLYLASNIEEIPGFFIQDLEQVMERPVDFRSMKTFFPASEFPTLNETPLIDGQVIMTLKPGAKRMLWTERGIPLLALWEIGKGSSAVFGADSGQILAENWTGKDSAPLWNLFLAKLVQETESAPQVYYQRRGRAIEVKYRSDRLPHGSTVEGWWHRWEEEPVKVDFTETAPGEHTALIPSSEHRPGHLVMKGTGANGFTEEATLSLPPLSESGLVPPDPPLTFETPTAEPGLLDLFREPILWRLLFIFAILLVTMDEFFRPPGESAES
jgi:hypothetical protein